MFLLIFLASGSCQSGSHQGAISFVPSSVIPYGRSTISPWKSGFGYSTGVITHSSAGTGIGNAVLYGCVSAGAMVLIMLCFATILLLRRYGIDMRCDLISYDVLS